MCGQRFVQKPMVFQYKHKTQPTHKSTHRTAHHHTKSRRQTTPSLSINDQHTGICCNQTRRSTSKLRPRKQANRTPTTKTTATPQPCLFPRHHKPASRPPNTPNTPNTRASASRTLTTTKALCVTFGTASKCASRRAAARRVSTECQSAGTSRWRTRSN